MIRLAVPAHASLRFDGGKGPDRGAILRAGPDAPINSMTFRDGYTIDAPRQIWKYRDWVISALNADMPFDQFTVEQIAGDLLPDASDQQRLATAFHRNHPITIEGGVIDEEYRTEYVIDRVVTTSTVWMGMTMLWCLAVALLGLAQEIGGDHGLPDRIQQMRLEPDLALRHPPEETTLAEALIADLRVNAPHIKCSVAMPGHVGTPIIANSRRVLSGRDRTSDRSSRRMPRPLPSTIRNWCPFPAFTTS